MQDSAVQRNVFIVHALLSEATRSSSFLHPSPTGITGKFQVSLERLLLALCFLRPSPVARAGISKRKRQRARSRGTMRPDIAQLNYVYYCCYYYYYYSSPSRFQVDIVDVSTRVLLCAHRGDVYLMAYNYRPWKNSTPRHQTVLSFPSLPSQLYGINVLAPSPDVINPRRALTVEDERKCLNVNFCVFL